MKSVDIGGVTISIEDTGHYTADNRAIFEWTVVLDHKIYNEADLKSGCWSRPTETEMLETLLAFLGAAAESYRYAGMEGENSNLFPEPVAKWASENSDEISFAQGNLEEEMEAEKDEMQHAEAMRNVAYSWHGGQDSALYAFASSGLCEDVGELVDEIDDCLALAREEERQDLESLRDFVVELKNGLDHEWQNLAAPWANEWLGE